MTAQIAPDNAANAAVIAMLLGDEQAAALLARLEPEELTLIGSKMIDLGEIAPDAITSAILNFVSNAESQSLPSGERPEHVRRVMTQAVGDMKANNLMQRIAPDADCPTVELARWLSPDALLSLVEGEHAQAIAVLLLMIEAEPAAQVLAGLPEEIQPDVVERVARLGPVSPHAVEMLESVLKHRVANQFGSEAIEMGGVRQAADLINAAAGNFGKIVLPIIGEKDADLAKRIENEMFTFDMLFDLDAMAMGRLLRDVENEALVDALKGLPEEDREPFFAAMSSRAADGVKDEIEMRGKLKRSEVDEAQSAVIAKARELADAGEISFGADDGDFV